MGFLRRFFGGDESKQHGQADPQGFFVYVQCDRCGAKVRLRINKQYDLIPAGDGYDWHKTIVDSQCFQRIPTVAHFDRDLNMTHADIQGGRYISLEEYEAEEDNQPADAEEEDN